MLRNVVIVAVSCMALAVPPAAASDVTPWPHPPVPRSAQLPAPDAGAPRTLHQLMWDRSDRALVRRRIEVLDLFAGSDLDLMWEPRSGEAVAGPANGPGRLVWRVAGAAVHDAASVVAEFQGTLRAGHPDGQGALWHASGATYRGGWRGGRMDGEGVLRWADGEQYEGSFRAGLFHGDGRLTLRDGSVFAGGFREGQRHGSGREMPAGGRSFRSVWEDGIEVAASRVAEAGPAGLLHLELIQQGGYPDVRVNVGVNRSYPEGYGPGDIIMYEGVIVDDALVVMPEDTEFVDAWRGNAPLAFDRYGGDYYKFTEDYQEPASFTFDVENAGVAPLFLIGGHLSVAESVPDLDPALRVQREIDCRQPTITSFVFENYGWSQPAAPRIDGGVLTPGGGQVVQPLSGEVDEGWPRAEIDLRGALENLGVRFDFFDNDVVPCGGAADACLAELRQSGLLGSVADAAYIDDDSLMVDFGGRLDYTWQDAGGEAHAKSSLFLVPLKIGNLPGELQTCAEGGGGLEVYPDPFMLQDEGQGYRVPFSANATVAPGEVSRWSFQVDAPMSSLHEFQVVLQLADGREVASRPVLLSYWKPASPWTN